MPTYLDKSATVALLRREFDALGELGSTLTEDQWRVPTCLPGWTVHDVLAHLIGTELMLCGETPPPADLEGLNHLKNPVAEANEVWVQWLRPLPGPALVARWNEVTSRRVDALDAMTQDEFDAPSWTPAGRDETYGRFMRIRHYDCAMHEGDIRAALGMAPRTDGDGLRSCLDEVATGLGYIVGRKAAIPDGSTVRIDLTGPVEATFSVRVEGRASVVDHLDGPATVGIELPVTLFLRLTGGRDDGPLEEGAVQYSGDKALGARLVANLAFTI